MPARPSLYSSPIQQVLVLQEDDQAASDQPHDSCLACNATVTRASSPAPTPAHQTHPLPNWRVLDRMKTTHGALVVCLDLGFDASDFTKPDPFSRLHCWTIPNPAAPAKTLQHVAATLRRQYERWQPRTRYKIAPDPTYPDLKRVCLNLRRAAKEDRVMFHYGGLGVPRPTDHGELWVFSQNYTHYIPFNFLDIHEAIGNPTLFIFDCDCAGTLYHRFKLSQQIHEAKWREACAKQTRQPPLPLYRDSIFLGACGFHEDLPITSLLPADLFTSCLTTPIKTALHWFLSRTLVRGVTVDMIDRIPGSLGLKESPLGELHWIFTATTDAIAWTVLPRHVFMKFYRQDLLLANLMRNFLLADRIMRSFGRHPVSHPPLPETHTHHLWHSFDLAMEQILSQIPAMFPHENTDTPLEEEEELRGETLSQHVRLPEATGRTISPSPPKFMQRAPIVLPAADPEKLSKYQPSRFFRDNMQAFEVWLGIGPDQRDPPEHLPIMLQVLLSPSARLRALPILSGYMQTGPEAVYHSLSVGYFPYVLKLLQSNSERVTQDLVFIWSKILAFDDTCRSDLVKEKGEEYFVRFLTRGRKNGEDPEPVYLAVAMFVLSVVAKDYAERCHAVGTVKACHSKLSHESPFVRRWACLCLAEVIKHSSPQTQLQSLSWVDLVAMLKHRSTSEGAPDVRAAAVSALSVIMNGVLKKETSDREHQSADASPSSEQGPGNKEPTDSAPGAEKSAQSSPVANGDVPKSIQKQLTTRNTDEKNLTAEGPQGFESLGSSLSEKEKDALHTIGNLIADVGRWDASVLVRREVATAISFVTKQHEQQFVEAAYDADVLGFCDEDNLGNVTDKFYYDLLYRKLWTALSELAYDPHPVVAAVARGSYDQISERVMKGTSLGHDGSWRSSSPLNTIASPPNQATDVNYFQELSSEQKVSQTEDSELTSTLSHSHEAQREISKSVSPSTVSPSNSAQDSQMRYGKGGESSAIGPFDMRPGSHPPTRQHSVPKRENLMLQRLRKRLGVSNDSTGRAVKIGTGSVSVRSASGSFNLDSPSRLPFMSTLPRVNSASLLPVSQGSGDSSERGRLIPYRSRTAMTGSLDFSNPSPHDETTRSGGHIALAKGVGQLVKTFSQQFNLSALARSPDDTSKGERRGAVNDSSIINPTSPPRPPRRSLSYQVLNTAAALSPDADSSVFRMSRKTSYFFRPGSGTNDSKIARRRTDFSLGGDRVRFYGANAAALSLYEWSSTYISKVEFNATTSDYMHEEDSIPRYAALWHKFTTSNSEVSVEESLRAFARFKEDDSLRVGPVVAADDVTRDFVSSRQLSLYSMGAGGGSVTGMAFLPRDSGMGDDLLLATGDSTGSIGVYDVRTGNCQGSFGVPSPPGIPEVGISSVICLNNHTPLNAGGEFAVPNSRSALILAGAYDGRVAVFKSDVQGRKYRTISTFQASGQSFWSKAGTSRDSHANGGLRASSGIEHRAMQAQGLDDPDSSGSGCFAEAVRCSGNGLTLSFDSASSYLAAGGCDSDCVRIWDLQREQCIWEGAAVSPDSWPTALSMWDRVHPKVFVVGSSQGSVNVIDMREASPGRGTGRIFKKLGVHSLPIISVGTCPGGRHGYGEVAVAADIGGEMAFWEPRWDANGMESQQLQKKDEVTRIKAHSSDVAAMAVHPSGRYIASGSTFGSTGKCVKIFGPNRQLVKMISHYEQTSGDGVSRTGRISPVTSLSFQHETSLLAIGCIDSSVMIYGRPEHFSGL